MNRVGRMGLIARVKGESSPSMATLSNISLQVIIMTVMFCAPLTTIGYHYDGARLTMLLCRSANLRYRKHRARANSGR